MASTNTDIAAKLDEARALIEKGWCQRHAAVDRDGRPIVYERAVAVCSWGAIDAVAHSNFSLSEAMCAAVERAVEREVVGFNDDPGRTQAEVVEAFRKAAALVRGETA